MKYIVGVLSFLLILCASPMLLMNHYSDKHWPSVAINEQMQDAIDNIWGIENALSLSISMCDQDFAIPNGTVMQLRSYRNSQRMICNRFGGNYVALGRVWIGNDLPSSIKWNHNSGFTAIWMSSPSVLAIMENMIVLSELLLLLTACIWFRRAPSDCKKLPFVFLLLCGVWTTSFLFKTCIYPRNYNHTYTDVLYIAKQNQEALRKILDSANKTGLVEADFLTANKNILNSRESSESLKLYPDRPQERNICGNKVFVSNGILFPSRYIRINVDAYTYLFWIPDANISHVCSINSKISFTNVGNGFWIGSYPTLITEMSWFIWSHYVMIVSGLIVAVASTRMLIKIFRNKHIKMKNKSC